MPRTTLTALLSSAAAAIVLIAAVGAQEPKGEGPPPPPPKRKGPGGPGGPNAGRNLAPQILKAADADGDGRLSPEEAAAAASRFVREADKDKKGSIDFETLLAAMGRQMGGPPPLGSADYPPRGHGPGDMQAISVMDLADANRDDHLSPEEAAKAAERLVREADKDKKGSVDLDALREAIVRAMRPPFDGPFGPPVSPPPRPGDGPARPKEDRPR